MKLAYESIVDFLSSAPTPRRILKYKVSARVQTRVADLIGRKEDSALSEEDNEELESYLNLEHIMRIAKAKAALRIQRGE